MAAAYVGALPQPSLGRPDTPAHLAAAQALREFGRRPDLVLAAGGGGENLRLAHWSKTVFIT